MADIHKFARPKLKKKKGINPFMILLMLVGLLGVSITLIPFLLFSLIFYFMIPKKQKAAFFNLLSVSNQLLHDFLGSFEEIPK